jgi:hypothetical protein
MFDTESKNRYLTSGWNNVLSAVLGLPALAYAVVAFATSVWSVWVAFAGMVAVGAVY